MSPLIYTVDANAFELFSKADGRLRALDRMLVPGEVVLADKVQQYSLLAAARGNCCSVFSPTLCSTRSLLLTPASNFLSHLLRDWSACCTLLFFWGRRGGAVRGVK